MLDTFSKPFQQHVFLFVVPLPFCLGKFEVPKKLVNNHRLAHVAADSKICSRDYNLSDLQGVCVIGRES